MGTRADFYVGRGKDAEWIGSIAFDGYPDGQPANPKFGPVINAQSVEQFTDFVSRLLSDKEASATKPEQGWPWPWEDSQTTDYAYAFDGGKVWASCFGQDWFDPLKKQPESGDVKKAVFPNMKDKQNVTLGPRSGLIVLGG